MPPTMSCTLLLLCLSLAGQLALGGPNSGRRLNIPVDSTCLPEMPPGSDPPNSSAPAVLLQTHQWVWIENTTDPSWAPRTEQGSLSYYFLNQGVVMNASVSLVALNRVYVPFSILTNGKTLCMSSMTLYRDLNENGTSNTLECNRTCFTNFTNLGKPMNLPLLVYNFEFQLSRSFEYLAVDSLDPSERDSFKCLGLFTNRQLSELPHLRENIRQCPQGDMCLFNYDGSVIDAGCKTNFRFDWCVGNTSLCDYTSGRDCPICCRGEFCNRAVADDIYRVWGGDPGVCRASSLTILAAAALSLLWLRPVL